MTVLDARLAELKVGKRYARTDGRSLGSIAIEKAAADPDRIAVVDAVRPVTRAEMLDAAQRLGGALQARGIEPGSTIAFQLPNWWEACVINLTAALFRYRLAPLLTIYRTAELGHMVPACEIEAIFIPDRFRGMDYPALIGSLPQKPRHIFSVRSDAPAPLSFEHALEHSPADPLPAPADDLKMILFTSGSTGTPKGVLHSHGAFDELIRRTADFWGTGRDDRLYVPSPIGHIGGSIYAFEFPWITDCVAILAETWDPESAVSEIQSHGATFMAGATPYLSGMIDAAERLGTSLPTLRRFICGGASVPPELVRRGLEQFASATVSRAYGSTEVPLVCPGVRSRAEAETRADTDGEISTDLVFLDEKGVAGDAYGEIAVRAPQMLMGYLDPGDEAGCFTEDGFFKMGDLGRRIDGRFLEITGRKKDIIIRKGENISPLEIENALARHPAVRQCAVVGVPDKGRGEMVVAFVIPKKGASFEFADMVSHLDRLGLAKQKYPERLHVVSSLPVSAVGKVIKSQLRSMASGTEGSGA